MTKQHIHFVTGRLAEPSLRAVLQDLKLPFDHQLTIETLPITVAALMTTEWIANHIQVPTATNRVILPGYCQGDLEPLASVAGCPVEKGPRDLRRLPEWFGVQQTTQRDDDHYDIEVIAEINHAPQLSLKEVLQIAQRLRANGADVIDIGCDPGHVWTGVAGCVGALRDEGFRVSIDSMNPHEIEAATRAGAELVLSVNHENIEAAADWGCEVVAIPDTPAELAGLDDTVERLEKDAVPYRVDTILEPIGMGFTASLDRYQQYRKQYPNANMLMGIGNLTELTDADSAGINILLLAICQELGIRSVLTTEVINWARTSVRECDLARRLVFHAIESQTLPKHVEPRLVMLRDTQVLSYSEDEIQKLADQLKDHNFRIFTTNDEIHVAAAGLHVHDRDPFRLFEAMMSHDADRIDANHAFYLGFEMAKALTALTLSKEYCQDEALDWGYLTVPEHHHRLDRKSKRN